MSILKQAESSHVVGKKDAKCRLFFTPIGERWRATVCEVEESRPVVARNSVDVAIQPSLHVSHVLVAAI